MDFGAFGGVVDLGPLVGDGEAEFHPLPGFGEGGIYGECLVGEGVA